MEQSGGGGRSFVCSSWTSDYASAYYQRSDYLITTHTISFDTSQYAFCKFVATVYLYSCYGSYDNPPYVMHNESGTMGYNQPYTLSYSGMHMSVYFKFYGTSLELRTIKTGADRESTSVYFRGSGSSVSCYFCNAI